MNTLPCPTNNVKNYWLKLSNTFYWILIVLLISSISDACSKKNSNPGGTPQQPGNTTPAELDTVNTVYVSGGRSNQLYALDASTGRIKWSVPLGGIANLSPAYAGGKIFVGAADQKLYALDTSGNVSWSVSMADPFRSAPLAENGLVYISASSSVLAIEAQTGHTRWQFSDGGTSHLTYNNNTLFFNAEDNRLHALDALSGKEKWHYDSAFSGSIPIVSGNQLYFIQGDKTMLVLNATTGTTITATKAVFPYSAYNLAIAHNVKYGGIYFLEYNLYGGSDGVACADSANLNNVNFNTHFFSIFQAPGIMPIFEDCLIVMPFAVLNARTGADLGVNMLSGSNVTGISYLNGTVYCLTGQKDFYDPYSGGYQYADIMAVDVHKNQIVWRTPIKNADFYGVEPCIVSRSGTAYTGGLSFK